ncbi:MAG: archease, partial [Chloroflexi bacterium]|nr:archease [Chloroflexota bacterium]
VKVSSADREGLLVDWLNELLYVFDVEHLLLVRFEVDKLDDNSLEARCYGEKVDLGRHRIKAGVKAATYHMVSVEEREGVRVRVILDI